MHGSVYFHRGTLAGTEVVMRIGNHRLLSQMWPIRAYTCCYNRPRRRKSEGNQQDILEHLPGYLVKQLASVLKGLEGHEMSILSKKIEQNNTKSTKTTKHDDPQILQPDLRFARGTSEANNRNPKTTKRGQSPPTNSISQGTQWLVHCITQKYANEFKPAFEQT